MSTAQWVTVLVVTLRVRTTWYHVPVDRLVSEKVRDLVEPLPYWWL